MHDFLAGIVDGAAKTAAGILVAVAILAGAWYLLRPVQSITVDLSEYACATDGKAVICTRK